MNKKWFHIVALSLAAMASCTAYVDRASIPEPSTMVLEVVIRIAIAYLITWILHFIVKGVRRIFRALKK